MTMLVAVMLILSHTGIESNTLATEIWLTSAITSSAIVLAPSHTGIELNALAIEMLAGTHIYGSHHHTNTVRYRY